MSDQVTALRANSPGAFGLSLLLHGAVVAVIMLSAYVLNDATKKNNDGVFEVVAGPGDNWAATEAPALGSPDAVVFTPPADTPRPAVIPETAVPPLTPTEPVHAAPRQNTTKPMTFAEFNKLYGKQNQTMPSNKTRPRNAGSAPAGVVTASHIAISGRGLAGGIDGGSGSQAGAGGSALTAAMHDEMDAYFSEIAERVKQAHEQPAGAGAGLVTRVEYYVAADGTIGSVKVIRSSGNSAFDDSVLKAFRSVAPIGPRPDRQGGSKIADFRVKEE